MISLHRIEKITRFEGKKIYLKVKNLAELLPLLLALHLAFDLLTKTHYLNSFLILTFGEVVMKRSIISAFLVVSTLSFGSKLNSRLTPKQTDFIAGICDSRVEKLEEKARKLTEEVEELRKEALPIMSEEYENLTNEIVNHVEKIRPTLQDVLEVYNVFTSKNYHQLQSTQTDWALKDYAREKLRSSLISILGHIGFKFHSWRVSYGVAVSGPSSHDVHDLRLEEYGITAFGIGHYNVYPSKEKQDRANLNVFINNEGKLTIKLRASGRSDKIKDEHLERIGTQEVDLEWQYVLGDKKEKGKAYITTIGPFGGKKGQSFNELDEKRSQLFEVKKRLYQCSIEDKFKDNSSMNNHLRDNADKSESSSQKNGQTRR